jgi:hypothetical protein
MAEMGENKKLITDGYKERTISTAILAHYLCGRLIAQQAVLLT